MNTKGKQLVLWVGIVVLLFAGPSVLYWIFRWRGSPTPWSDVGGYAAMLQGIGSTLALWWIAKTLVSTEQEQERSRRLSIKPLLGIDVIAGINTFHVILRNRGVGPALIRRLRVEHDGASLLSLREIIEKHFSAEPAVQVDGMSAIDGDAVAAGESLDLLSITLNRGTPFIDQGHSYAMFKMMMEVSYRCVVVIEYQDILEYPHRMRKPLTNASPPQASP